VDGAIATLTGRFGFTVIVVTGDVAGEPVAQVALEVRIHVTASLLLNEDEVYVVLLVPTLELLTCHWYDGLLPPLVGVAVKVTEAPLHIGLADGAIVTLTGRFEFTVMVTAPLVTVHAPDITWHS